MIRPINYGRHQVDQDDIDAVIGVLRSDTITQGPFVEKFEKAIADRVGARHAIAVSSGTAGLHIACLAAGLKPGSKGITAAVTFAASANAMVYCGAEALQTDIDLSTISMEPEKLNSSLHENPEIEVVIPVHMAGLSGDMAKIKDVADGRIIIEDASHALGSIYPCGKPVGSGAYAEMTIFSFHPVKPITTGEGGLVVTNDDDFAHQLRLLRNHGIERDAFKIKDTSDAFSQNGEKFPWYQEQQLLGFNYRMSDIHAALGLSQLSKLDKFIERRRELASRYDEEFQTVDYITPYHSEAAQRSRSSQHLYLVNIDFQGLGISREELMIRLAERNIGTQVHYIPLYRHPYHGIKNYEEKFPHAEKYYHGALSLPLFQDLSDEEFEYVISNFRDICESK
jgi:perosamine synthetase